MATIAGVSGKQYVEGSGTAYTDEKYQYATSSHGKDHNMNPALIVQPANKEDIAKVLKYAKSQGVAVAIRTGGHQYSGASSTGAPNIQLDLGKTFQGPNDRQIFQKDGETFFRTSVSWRLGDFNQYLGDHSLFIPHGQCINVHLGGHAQTGGYGQLGRSFGLLGDHVVSLEIVDYQGNFIEVSKTNHPELYFGLLGGSPGNFGVLTHLTLEVYRDVDYVGSRGMRVLYEYSPKTLKRLVDILVKMSDDVNFPRNYDLCVSVLSSSFRLGDFWEKPDLDEKMKFLHPEIYGEDGVPFWPRSIILYAQWVPFAKGDICDVAWFDQFKEGLFLADGGDFPEPMSVLTKRWIFRNIREFHHPYVKRTYSTASTTLGKDDWAGWVTERIDTLVKPSNNGCWLSCQLQCFGGKNSQFTANANNGTAYSWRDSTIVATLDCFYDEDDPAALDRANDWQRGNDTGNGPNGKFSKHDRRVLWGSYGEYDLDKVWNTYYETREKYERLGKARQAADPDGIFTPNTFCVKRVKHHWL